MNRNMSLIVSILTMEARGQIRSGLSILYLGMPVFWIIVIRLLPEGARPLTALIGSYADPVMMGQIFTGAFLARERDQGILEALAVSPLGAGGWLASRILLIGLQGGIGGLLLAAGSGVPFNPALLFPGIFLAASSGALIGLLTARPFRDMLTYFVAGGFGAALFGLPVIGYVLSQSPFWMIPGPAASGWATLSAAFGCPDRLQSSPGFTLAVLALWTGILFLLVRLIYHRGFFSRPGKGAPA